MADTPQEYIQHHLTNAKVCLVDGGIAVNKGCYDAGFWTLHWDSLLFSFGLGALFFVVVLSCRKKCNHRHAWKAAMFR